jgi:hypothetical protein
MQVVAQIDARGYDGIDLGTTRVSEELDDPQVLKRLAKRLALSTLGGLAAGLAGTAIALAIYRPVVAGLGLDSLWAGVRFFG